MITLTFSLRTSLPSVSGEASSKILAPPWSRIERVSFFNPLGGVPIRREGVSATGATVMVNVPATPSETEEPNNSDENAS